MQIYLHVNYRCIYRVYVICNEFNGLTAGGARRRSRAPLRVGATFQLITTVVFQICCYSIIEIPNIIFKMIYKYSCYVKYNYTN